MWETTIVGIIIVLIGVFLFCKPKTFWELTEKWKSYYADEPSEFYLKSTKFGGICIAVLGLALIIAPFILK